MLTLFSVLYLWDIPLVSHLLSHTSIDAVLILPIVFYINYGPDTAILGIWWSVNYAEFLALVVTVLFLIKSKKKYNY